ncbi:hypothetical protein [Bacillus sp. JJ1562]|uniref:hypothetical protein n=1 Tax=Bacillus sp. JJ1562 TaxID=3122960 RepID=UPI0030022D0B
MRKPERVVCGTSTGEKFASMSRKIGFAVQAQAENAEACPTRAANDKTPGLCPGVFTILL